MNSNKPKNILTPNELEGMRKACKFAAKLLNHLEPMVKPGVSTQEINDEAERFTQAHGASSAPLGYHGFPRSLCTSIDEVVCHGIPNKDRILKEGEIINIDVSPKLNGFYGDTSRTFAVGRISKEAQKLLDVTYECLKRGIREVAPGKTIGDIGAVIQDYAETFGYGVVREYVGHGIGKEFHCDPQVPHFGKRGQGVKLVAGMIFTIEPMINQGTWKTKLLADKWTAVTQDGKLSAQFEHAVLVTETGYEILTLESGDPFTI